MKSATISLVIVALFATLLPQSWGVPTDPVSPVPEPSGNSGGGISGLLYRILSTVANLVTGLLGGFQNPGTTIPDNKALLEFLSKIKLAYSHLNDILKSLPGAGTKENQALLSTLNGTLHQILKDLEGFINGTTKVTGELLKDINLRLNELLKNLLAFVASIVKDTGAQQIIKDTINKIFTSISCIIEALKNKSANINLQELLTVLFDTLKGLLGKVKGNPQWNPDNISENVNSILGAIIKFLQGIFNSGLPDDKKAQIGEIIEAIKKYNYKYGDDIGKLNKDLGDELSKLTSILDGYKDKDIQGLLDIVKDILGSLTINSNGHVGGGGASTGTTVTAS